MTDNPNVSPYVAEALKRAQLPISVMYRDSGDEDEMVFCVHVHGDRFGTYHESPSAITALYVHKRTRLLREQQQVK